MMRRFVTVLSVVTLSIAGLSGCSWTQRGAAVGGLAGAGIGGGWASTAGNLSAAEGALVGLAAGGLAGALAGDLLDQKQMRDLQNDYENYKQEAEARQKKLQNDLEKARADLREKDKELEELRKEIADLRKKLGALGEEIKVSQREGEIILTILGETLYASGKAQLTANGKKVLDRVMGIVRENFPDREIMVRGHTDSEPIKYSPWDDNWQLGSERALGVLRYLMKKHGVKGENISAGTYSYYRPVETNETAAGRRQNRRAEIVILPKREVNLKKFEK